MDTFTRIIMNVLVAFALFTIITLPLSLSIINVIGLFWKGLNRKLRIISWALTLAAGIVLSILYTGIGSIRFDADWSMQLYNEEIHQPFWTGSAGIYIAIAVIAVIGFVILAAAPLSKTPPLLLVISMAAQYPFAAACIVWCVQLSTIAGALPFTVLPINMIIIMLSLFRMKITEWQTLHSGSEAGEPKNAFIGKCNRLLGNAKLWPLWAFIAMIPLLAIILGISVLFGQQPDALIKAWTETAEWRLSGRTAPPNLFYDEHYLCTVAAGGHEKIVKPIRMGERHGHRVAVNRQLEVANAFEQILEERTPHFHKMVRGFYDRCGFPIAKLIRTKTACDIVYILMKPLEWIFLCVIYLTDTRPEDRIVIQYMPGYREYLK